MLLVYIAYLHCLAHGESTRVGLLQPHNQAEQGGLTAAVGTDNAHDARRGQREGKILVE